MMKKSLLIVVFSVLVAMGCREKPEEIFLGVVDVLALFDVNNNNNAADLRVIFYGASNVSHIYAYRVMIVKSDLMASFSVADAEALNPQEFFEISSYYSLVKVYLPEDLLDTDGDSITNNQEYVAFVMSRAEAAGVQSQLSSPSVPVMMEEKELRDIYISNRSHNSVELLDGVTGEYLGSFVGRNSNGLTTPRDILFGPDGHLLVVGKYNDAVKKFDIDSGTFISDFTHGFSLSEASKAAIGPDSMLYVGQGGLAGSVVRFNIQTGAFVDEYITGLSNPTGLAWDTNGRLYVASYNTGEVWLYHADGTPDSVFVSGITGPVDIWFDKAGDMFVNDWPVGEVKRYSATGEPKAALVTGLSAVEGHAYNGHGGLMLCDVGQGTINLYDSATGKPLSNFYMGGVLENPNSIVFGPNKNMLTY
ncbi:MAG: hypothetical protein OEX02_20085 [Cyclobacteriaceae bacterium]|nr:hypothetical protein [Cyclobacteriaceae bacterium]